MIMICVKNMKKYPVRIVVGQSDAVSRYGNQHLLYRVLKAFEVDGPFEANEMILHHLQIDKRLQLLPPY